VVVRFEMHGLLANPGRHNQTMPDRSTPGDPVLLVTTGLAVGDAADAVAEAVPVADVVPVAAAVPVADVVPPAAAVPTEPMSPTTRTRTATALDTRPLPANRRRVVIGA
jgi:hypothetical protein